MILTLKTQLSRIALDLVTNVGGFIKLWSLRHDGNVIEGTEASITSHLELHIRRLIQNRYNDSY